MQAMSSSMISSRVLITRACCISCWPSTTSMPSRWRANSTGGSIASTPTGSPSRPRCSSSTRIFAATSSARPDSGDIAPRIVEMPARERPSEPWAVDLVMARRRAEVPHDRVVALRQQAEAVELVHRPGADVGRRDVADVAHVEAQQRAELRLREQRLDPRQALLAQAVEADPLLPVDAHHAVAMQSHRPLPCANDCNEHTESPVQRITRCHAIVETPPALGRLGT